MINTLLPFFYVAICLLILEIICRVLESFQKKKSFRYFINKYYVKEAFQEDDLKKRDEFIHKAQALTHTCSVPIIGWTMKPGTNNGVVWTDENGFRNDSNINVDGKTVVAVFGGSVALGGFASDNNSTISGKLQHYLREEYENDIIVLNFAQSSFTMIQEISLFNLLVDCLNIKVSIFIDGVNDLSSVNKNNPEFFNFIGPFFGGWEKTSKGIIKVDTFLKTSIRFACQFSAILRSTKRLCIYIRKLIRPSCKNVEDKDYDGQEIVNKFKCMTDIVSKRLNNSEKYALITLQPCIYDYKKPSVGEKEFIDRFDPDHVFWWQKQYANLKDGLFKKWHSFYVANKVDDNVILSDFTKIMDHEGSSVFVDDCHFADRGNDLYAWNIFKVIKTQEWLKED